MANVPKVSVSFLNGQLLPGIAVQDGIAGLVMNGTATGQLALNTPVPVYNMNDVKALGITGLPVGTTAATAAVTITAFANGSSYVLNVPGAAPIALANVTPADGATLAQIATAVAAAINAGTATHGYSATSAAAVVTITAPVALGNTINGTNILATLSGAATVTSTPFAGGVSITYNDVAYRHLSEYYAELAGNQKLWIMLVAPATTMTQMLDNANANGAKKLLNVAGGEVRLIGLARKPAAGYNAGNDFIDSDVPTAVLAAKTFAEARLAELAPVRILIEGRVANENSTTIYSPRTAQVGAAGVVLGGSLADGSASVGLTLGRAVKYGAHIKLGKVANGPLSIATAFIGSKALKDVSSLETLHGTGYISLLYYAQKAGFYFGIDRMASTDDYRLLVYGRTVDKVAVIAAQVFINDLESEVETNEQGHIDEAAAKHLEDRIKLAVNTAMDEQISSFNATVDQTVNIINNDGKLPIQLKTQPLGYLTEIPVTIGLNAGN